MTTTPKYDYPKPGCYIDESAGSADDCNRRTIDFATGYGFKADLDANQDVTDSEYLSEAADEAVSYLNSLDNLPFTYWTFEDNSLFLTVDVDGCREQMIEDGFITGKDGLDCPPDDYRGEWLHVSDHGNATLYVRGDNGQDMEVWGVV